MRRINTLYQPHRPIDTPTNPLAIDGILGVVASFAPWSTAAVSKAGYAMASGDPHYRLGVAYGVYIHYAPCCKPSLPAFADLHARLEAYAQNLLPSIDRLRKRRPPVDVARGAVDTAVRADCFWCGRAAAVPRRTVAPVAWKDWDGVVSVQYVEKHERWIVYEPSLAGLSFVCLHVACRQCLAYLQHLLPLHSGSVPRSR
jgi:hypothetical protein